jgi:hypothetical protein
MGHLFMTHAFMSHAFMSQASVIEFNLYHGARSWYFNLV